MTYIDEKALFDELKCLIEGYLGMTRGLFGRSIHSRIAEGAEAKGLRDVTVPLETIERLPIAARVRKALCYLNTGRFDRVGGFYHPQDIYIFLRGFLEMMNHAQEFEISQCDPTLLRRLVTGFLGRWKIDEPDEAFGGDLTMSEVMVLTGMSEQSIRNAASRGEIKLDLNETCEMALSARGWFRDPYVIAANGDIAEWLKHRQGYLRLPDGVAPIYDSMDEHDPTKFLHVSEFVDWLIKIAADKGVPAAAFLRKTGHTLDHYRDTKNNNHFVLGEWVEIAHLLGLESLWLVSRLFGTFEFSFGLDQFFALEAITLLEEDHRKKAAKEDNVRIPVAADGSWFHPGLRGRHGYKIGRKGNGEVYIDDYFSAVDALQKMDPPYWRRPSPGSGKSSCVKGVSWRLVARRELLESLD